MPRFRMDAATLCDADWLIERALAEDLAEGYDCTSLSVVPESAHGSAQFTARRAGTICGMEICQRIIDGRNSGLENSGLENSGLENSGLENSGLENRGLESRELEWQPLIDDGEAVTRDQAIAVLRGPAREMLMVERTCLNFLGRLSGIATLTSEFVAAVRGTSARIHDTRKTTPGWRRLEKYAVKCGGGTNHRMGLFDAVLIKDNHLAMLGQVLPPDVDNVSEAVRRAKEWIGSHADSLPRGLQTPVQIEVDRLSQLPTALRLSPDMVLLDNMTLEQLREAVVLRNEMAPRVELEASGGVRLETVAAIARTGVDRISAGALTHSAVNFDIGMDWF